jgi:hypothetical protein
MKERNRRGKKTDAQTDAGRQLEKETTVTDESLSAADSAFSFLGRSLVGGLPAGYSEIYLAFSRPSRP